MTRAEKRRLEKETQKKIKTPTYQFTREQIDARISEEVNKRIKEIEEQVTDEVTNEVMILLLTLPMEVLMDHYWQDCYAEKIPEFTEHLLDYYERWQNDELDMEEMQKDLWEYGGVKLMQE